MEREIRFKAWFPIEKQMIFDYANNVNHISELRVIEFHKSSDLYLTKRVILLQNTGLKDQNKKDIYEGDIILFTENSKKHIVKYIEGGFRLTATNGNIIVYNINPKQIYVIGNIFENNDLLTI